MSEENPRPSGLKPTLRQIMILTLWAALMLAGLRFVTGTGLLGNTPDIVLMNLPLIAAAWPSPLLVALIWMLDRPGSVRSWYCGCVMMSWGAVSGLALLAQDAASLMLFGSPSATFPLSLVLGPLFFWSCWKQWPLVRPGRCVRCLRRAVITHVPPIDGNVGGPQAEIRLARCAICGEAHPVENPENLAWPRRCHRCGHTTVAAPPNKPRRRLSRKLALLRGGWCACCGMRHRRDGPTAWVPLDADAG